MALDSITKTGQDVYNFVTRSFGDEAGVQITANDILTWVNMGQHEVLLQNPVVKGTGVIDILANVNVYDPSALEILQIEGVSVSGFPITHKSYQEARDFILSQDPTNANRGLPTLWYDWAGQIYLYPTPVSNITGGLTLFYTKDAPTMTALSQNLFLPDIMFNRLCEYVMAMAYEQDEDSQNAQFKLGQFQAGLNRVAERENEVSNASYPTIRVLAQDEDYW